MHGSSVEVHGQGRVITPDCPVVICQSDNVACSQRSVNALVHLNEALARDFSGDKYARSLPSRPVSTLA